MIRLIDIHDYDILRKRNNKSYLGYIKENAIKSLLENNESMYSVALKLGLSGDGCFIIGYENIKIWVII